MNRDLFGEEVYCDIDYAGWFTGFVGLSDLQLLNPHHTHCDETSWSPQNSSRKKLEWNEKGNNKGMSRCHE